MKLEIFKILPEILQHIAFEMVQYDAAILSKTNYELFLILKKSFSSYTLVFYTNLAKFLKKLYFLLRALSFINIIITITITFIILMIYINNT